MSRRRPSERSTWQPEPQARTIPERRPEHANASRIPEATSTATHIRVIQDRRLRETGFSPPASRKLGVVHIAARSTAAICRTVAGRWDRSLSLAAGAIAAVVLTHLVDFGANDLGDKVLNANSASSWSHKVVTGSLAMGAIACLVGTWRLRRARATWLVTAVILVLLFANEISELHAQIGALRFGKLLYAPILLLLVFCVWRLTTGASSAFRVRAGGVLLLASYLIHVLGPHHIAHSLGWRAEGWAFQTVVALKEGLELAGVLLVVLALWRSSLQREREPTMT
jgi:hypothetical protein